jgi:hypothetical protein
MENDRHQRTPRAQWRHFRLELGDVRYVDLASDSHVCDVVVSRDCYIEQRLAHLLPFSRRPFSVLLSDDARTARE